MGVVREVGGGMSGCGRGSGCDGVVRELDKIMGKHIIFQYSVQHS